MMNAKFNCTYCGTYTESTSTEVCCGSIYCVTCYADMDDTGCNEDCLRVKLWTVLGIRASMTATGHRHGTAVINDKLGLGDWPTNPQQDMVLVQWDTPGFPLTWEPTSNFTDNVAYIDWIDGGRTIRPAVGGIKPAGQCGGATDLGRRAQKRTASDT